MRTTATTGENNNNGKDNNSKDKGNDGEGDNNDSGNGDSGGGSVLVGGGQGNVRLVAVLCRALVVWRLQTT